jgi:restriction endonuclease Mrr
LAEASDAPDPDRATFASESTQSERLRAASCCHGVRARLIGRTRSEACRHGAAPEPTEPWATRPQQVIDGERLAELRIDRNVGVLAREVYEVKRVDRDSFGDDA